MGLAVKFCRSKCGVQCGLFSGQPRPTLRPREQAEHALNGSFVVKNVGSVCEFYGLSERLPRDAGWGWRSHRRVNDECMVLKLGRICPVFLL